MNFQRLLSFFRLMGCVCACTLASSQVSGHAQGIVESTSEPRAPVFHCPEGLQEIEGYSLDGGQAHWCEHAGERSGVKEGPYLDSYPSGEKRIEASFKGGKENGPYTFYYRSGRRKKQGEFKDGQLSGQWRRWSESGSLTDVGRWSEGVPEGHWQFYAITGALEEEGILLRGIKAGPWLSYHAQEVRIQLQWKESSSAAIPKILGHARSRWLNFRVGELALLQSIQGSFSTGFSPTLGWNLFLLRTSSGLGLSLLFDSASLSDLGQGSRSLALEMLALGELSPGWGRGLTLELGAGLRTWFSYGSAFTAMLGVRSRPLGFGLVLPTSYEELYFDYGVWLAPSAPVHEIRAGVVVHVL